MTNDTGPEGGTTKGHKHSYTNTTLDRLENWLGLRDIPGSSQHPKPQAHAPKRSADVGSVAYAIHETPSLDASSHITVQVLVHTVLPTDTLEGISLKYGADAHVVRRSNRLWPGDVVQMRDQIYIPVDSCRWQPPDAALRSVMREGDGSLHVYNTEPSLSSSKKPMEKSNDDTPLIDLTVEQVEPETLQFFPGERAHPSQGIPMGHMGESGLDDLLEWQRKQRGQDVDLPRRQRPQPSTRQSQRKIATEKVEEMWRPNIRTLGARKSDRSSSLMLFDADQDESPMESHPSATRPPLTQPHSSTSSSKFSDFLRGPLPNPGAAANWVRPIHDSLPENAPHPRTTVSSNHIFSDLISGRVRMEDAVNAAMHEIRHATSTWNSKRRDNAQVLPM